MYQGFSLRLHPIICWSQTTYVDFSSTTAFYTVAHGVKIWRVEPTSANLQLIEKWSKIPTMRYLYSEHVLKIYSSQGIILRRAQNQSSTWFKIIEPVVLFKCIIFRFFRRTSFGNLNALTGRSTNLWWKQATFWFLLHTGHTLLRRRGDSIAFASNFLAVTHFPLIVDSQLKASQQELNEEEVFPAVVRIYAVTV